MSSRAWSNVPIGLMAGVGLLLAAGPVVAQALQSQQLEVSAVIGDLCTVTAASLNFGAYSGAALAASGAIEIDCAVPTDLEVELDGGQAGNGEGQRTMRNGADSLIYTLFVDTPGGTDFWETSNRVPAQISGSGSVPVHGTVAGFQTGIGAGVYTDLVNITLHF